MSRLYKMKKRFLNFKKEEDSFILNIFLKKLIKDGNYYKAKKLLIETLNIIREKEKKNSYLVFLLAVYNAAPKIKSVKRLNQKTNKIIFKKEVLPKIVSILWGINLILFYYNKNKGNSSSIRLANEIVQSFYKRSNSVKRRFELEKSVLKKTANDFGRKKQLYFNLKTLV